MLRTLLAVVAGVITAMLLMFALEAAGLMLFPPPAGLQINNEADLALLVEMSSTGKKAWVVFGWALASLVGGWVAARISRRHPRGGTGGGDADRHRRGDECHGDPTSAVDECTGRAVAGTHGIAGRAPGKPATHDCLSVA